MTREHKLWYSAILFFQCSILIVTTILAYSINRQINLLERLSNTKHVSETTSTSTINSSVTKKSVTATPSVKSQAIGIDEYKSKVTQAVIQYGIVFEEIETLTGLVDSDPTILFSDTWKGKIHGFEKEVTEAGNTIRNLDPPSEFSKTHSYLVQASRDYDSAMRFLVDGIDNLDSYKIQRASEEMTSGAQNLKLATFAIPTK